MPWVRVRVRFRFRVRGRVGVRVRVRVRVEHMERVDASILRRPRLAPCFRASESNLSRIAFMFNSK